jgi:hypothetical protein
MEKPRHTGRNLDNPDRPEIEHFANRPICGAPVDLPRRGAGTAVKILR